MCEKKICTCQSSHCGKSDVASKNTPDEMIEIINGIKEGKSIEVRALGTVRAEPWRIVDVKAPNFGMYQYRVKHEPVTLWCHVMGGRAYSHSNDEQSARAAAKMNGGYAAKFVEVLE